MAESAAVQAQAEVTERRLRPLYDALDYGQNKKAIQIADKILKKQKDLKCARVLKAIALLRLSRGPVANEIVERVLGAHPGDQATLQALTLFYRETGDFQSIAQVYADAAKHYPKSQEILTHLFMAYVRVGDSQKQQQVATQLTKTFPKSGPYQCWRVMSTLMQAEEAGNKELAKTMYLPLANKLIAKYFKDNSVDSEAEVRLYLMVLEKLDDTKQRLELLESAVGKKLKDEWERDTLIVAALQTLGRWEKASQKLAAMIETEPDSWFAAKAYINSQVERSVALYKEKSSSSEQTRPSGEGEDPANQPSTDSAPSNQTDDEKMEEWLHPLVEARDLFERLAGAELRKHEAKQLCNRCPLLSRLELMLCVRRMPVPSVPLSLGTTHDLLMDYFRVFGTKNCVFDDLKEYISPDGLPSGEVEAFVKDVEELVASHPINFDCPPEEVRENLSRMRRHISSFQLHRYLGHHEVPVQRKLELVALCLHHYRGGVKLGREFGENTSQPADFYMILAAHLKMEVYHETGDVRHAWEGVVMLEGVRNHNTQKSLLLMKLYGHLGVTEAVTNIYTSISIKHIQTETLGYIPGRYLQSMGTFGFANQLYRSAFRFFFQSSKEVSEYIIQCFKNGMFHKIPEMLRLRERLTHSFNFATIMIDMNMLELLTTVNSLAEADVFFRKEWRKGMPYTTKNLKDYCSHLSDSRDFDVLDDWSSPTVRLAGVETKITFDLECLWLRTRICLMKSLHAVLTCVTMEEVAKEKAPLPVELLTQQVQELRSTLEAMDQHVGTLVLKQRSKYQLHPVQSPPPCLGYVFHSEGHGAVLCHMLGAVHDLLSGAPSIREALEHILTRLQAIKSRIKGPSVDLREAMMKIASPTQDSADGDEGIVVTSPLDTEHPYDIITRSRLDLEEYVLFVQTLSHLTLLCALSAEHISPTFFGGKKKKRKKTSEESEPRPPVSDELVDFMKELTLILVSMSLPFQPFPSPRAGGDEEALVRQLSDLYISHPSLSVTGATYTQSPDHQDPHFKAWREGVAKACGAAISSYNMSFRDTLEVVTAKLQSLRAAVKQLGGHVD